MERLKAWLKEHNVEIIRPGIGNDGMVTLNLRPPSGGDFQVGFYPDDLEAEAQGVIDLVEAILAEHAKDGPLL